ncbi:hypothetical protein B0H10DRAFT_1248486 [Mycena sp. CBHHK59/15]|nr:hypothetical protein B0H10DRAFT_1248486 [Mycena sp. CBHHK59/15]
MTDTHLDLEARTQHAGAYTWAQWETCPPRGEQCLLDHSVPADPDATAAPNTCELGSIPPHFLDVRDADDVIKAFEFSRTTGVPLVIKNTGVRSPPVWLREMRLTEATIA